jgi:hypothetical protein
MEKFWSNEDNITEFTWRTEENHEKSLVILVPCVPADLRAVNVANTNHCHRYNSLGRGDDGNSI